MTRDPRTAQSGTHRKRCNLFRSLVARAPKSTKKSNRRVGPMFRRIMFDTEIRSVNSLVLAAGRLLAFGSSLPTKWARHFMRRDVPLDGAPLSSSAVSRLRLRLGWQLLSLRVLHCGAATSRRDPKQVTDFVARRVTPFASFFKRANDGCRFLARSDAGPISRSPAARFKAGSRARPGDSRRRIPSLSWLDSRRSCLLLRYRLVGCGLSGLNSVAIRSEPSVLAILAVRRPPTAVKTAAAMLEKAHSNSLRRMVTILIEQLVDIMPELREVTAWNTVGQRRTLDDYGRVVER